MKRAKPKARKRSGRNPITASGLAGETFAMRRAVESLEAQLLAMKAAVLHAKAWVAVLVVGESLESDGPGERVRSAPTCMSRGHWLASHEPWTFFFDAARPLRNLSVMVLGPAVIESVLVGVYSQGASLCDNGPCVFVADTLMPGVRLSVRVRAGLRP